MLKNKLIMVLFLFMGMSSVSAITLGGIGGFNTKNASLTGSQDKVEVELSITTLFSSGVAVSADYTLYESTIVDNLFWNVSAGAGISITTGGFGLNAIVPVELGYHIPDILEGLDIYLQAKPIINILPEFSPGYEIGLGVRVGL